MEARKRFARRDELPLVRFLQIPSKRVARASSFLFPCFFFADRYFGGIRVQLCKNHLVTIPTSRWLAYAGAGAATALTVAPSAEAAIHYSGAVNVTFGADETKNVSFPLDQAGDLIAFSRYVNINGVGQDYFEVRGVTGEGIRGHYQSFEYGLVDRIANSGRPVSQATFIGGDGTMVHGDRHFIQGEWKARGTSFAGFRFNNGSGLQYGWVRVQMGGKNKNFAFKVIDYAYADPGEVITTGQTSSSSGLPNEGSLGLLALGGAGLLLWRQRRNGAATSASIE